MCRTSSRFITPSSKFCIGGEKADAIKTYQASMSRVTCRSVLHVLSFIVTTMLTKCQVTSKRLKPRTRTNLSVLLAKIVSTNMSMRMGLPFGSKRVLMFPCEYVLYSVNAVAILKLFLTEVSCRKRDGRRRLPSFLLSFPPGY